MADEVQIYYDRVGKVVSGRWCGYHLVFRRLPERWVKILGLDLAVDQALTKGQSPYFDSEVSLEDLNEMLSDGELRIEWHDEIDSEQFGY